MMITIVFDASQAIKWHVGSNAAFIRGVEASIGFVQKTLTVESSSRITVASDVIPASKFPPLTASNNV